MCCFLRFYLFIHERDTEREEKTQVEGEAGSMQEAWSRIRPQDPRITTWVEDRCSTTEPPKRPKSYSVLQGNLQNTE